MKVQICRQCGNRNTVVSGPVSNCNYCGSTDLEPVTIVESPAGVAVDATESQSNRLAWLVLFSVLLIISASIWWMMQSMAEEQETAPTLLPSIENLASGTSKESIQESPASSVQMDSTNDLEMADQDAQNTSPTSDTVSSVEPSLVAKIDSNRKTVESENNAQTSADSEATQQLSFNEIAQESIAEPELEKVAEQNQDKSSVSDLQSAGSAIKPQLAEESPQPVVKQAEVQSKPVVNVVEEKKVAVVPQPKPVVSQPVISKPAVKKPVVKPAVKVTKVEPSQPSAAQLALKQEQEKVRKLQAILQEKQAKESRRQLRVLDRVNGVVTDRKTGLMWMACSVGQEWRGGYCAGDAEELLWSEAVNSAKETGYAGHSDWRLPTRNELDSLVQCSQDRVPYRMANNRKLAIKNGVLQDGKCLGRFSNPTIDQNVFPNTQNNFYWSYTFDASTNYSAWGVFFSSGHHYNFNTSNVGFARLVRTAY